ncbi:hypothetical protein [Bradyrhizobium sp.]|uniref:hypothetical protein n=1 Tax=Bradyrhizobium sp. TaxID=376 RepID=UPI0026345D50|nr:hypothetical protein [Bradyrhizobium sp.]
MFLVRPSTSEVTVSRVKAIRKLYRDFHTQNTREARGLRLLRDWLSPDQRTQFDDRDHFEVIGCDSGKRYRIYNRTTTGVMPNIHEIDEVGRSKMAWCFLPTGKLVAGDIMLAQKIALETNERNALAVANRFAPRPDLMRSTHRLESASWITRMGTGVWSNAVVSE